MSINPLVLQLETSAFRFEYMTYRVKDVVFTPKLLDQPFSHDLRKTDFFLRNPTQICLILNNIFYPIVSYLNLKAEVPSCKTNGFIDIYISNLK